MKKQTSGIRKNRRKLIVIIISLTVATAITAVFALYTIKHIRRSHQFKEAVIAFENGNFAKAEALLLNCIRDDRNNESAWEKLALLNEKKKQWSKAAQCWRFVIGLNRLENRYADAYAESLFRSQSYAEMIRVLEELPTLRDTDQVPALALAYLITGREEKAKKRLSSLPRNENNDRIRMARLYALLQQSKTVTGDMSAELNSLASSKDEAVAFLALRQQFAQAMKRKALAEGEKYLIRMTKINPEASYYLLGDFYYSQNRYDESVKAYGAASQYQMPQGAVMRYAETLFFTGDKATLTKIAPSFQQGSRETMLCGFYIEALIAYMDKKLDVLGEKLQQLGNFVNSPLSMIIRFDYAFHSRNAVMLDNVFREISIRDDLKKFYPVALEKVQLMFRQFYDNGRIGEIAGLAEWLWSKHPDNLLAGRIVLLNQRRKNAIVSGDLENCLAKFPDDPVILTVAVDYFNRRNDFAKALKLAERNIKRGNNSVYAALQYAAALEGASRIDEARVRFAELRKKHPDDLLVLKRQIAFCLRNNDPLPVFSDKREDTAVLRKFIAGEAARRSNNPRAMIEAFSAPELLQSLNPGRDEDLPLLYYAALRLAEADALKTAIDIYEKIKPALADPTLVHLNLSELYAASGDKPRALREAQSAWLANSGSAAVRSCYGLRQWESGNYAEAINLLSPLFSKQPSDARIVPALTGALEKAIVANYEAKKFSECLLSCKQLLKIDPGNRTALKMSSIAQNELNAAKSVRR